MRRSEMPATTLGNQNPKATCMCLGQGRGDHSARHGMNLSDSFRIPNLIFNGSYSSNLTYIYV